MARKLYLGIIIISLTAIAKPSTKEPSKNLQNSCLNCHIKQKIPSELIYRRYLMRYSTDKNMKEAIRHYLQKPQPNSSIMPRQFFLKFPPKERFDGNSSILKKNIKEYLDYFNVRGKLKLAS